MATLTFGNLQVDMTKPEFDITGPDFLDATIGANLDDDNPQESALPGQIILTFPTQWVITYQGNFTLGLNSPITGFEVDQPGDALLFSVTKISGLTVNTALNSTDAQL